jgi:hypothetical protein
MVTELVAQRRGQQWLPLLTDRTRREGGSAAEARRPQEARAGARIVLPGAAHGKDGAGHAAKTSATARDSSSAGASAQLAAAVPGVRVSWRA